jgi:hypothetical protein
MQSPEASEPLSYSDRYSSGKRESSTAKNAAQTHRKSFCKPVVAVSGSIAPHLCKPLCCWLQGILAEKNFRASEKIAVPSPFFGSD